ncbi:MAG: AEC family transporter [Erysipelotrichaceae bacterium]|nr:AEC family transporter [Erysipelotrichaceae bacterium]
MDAGLTIIVQIVKMFLLMGTGYFIYTKKWVDEHGSQQISNILLKICAPAITITSFNISFSIEKLQGIVVAFLLSSLSIVIGLAVAKIIYKDKNKIEQFAIGFSNAGFMGIPLVQGLLGIEYVMYISTFLVSFNLFAWTVGVYLVSGRKDLITPKLILYSPAVIGLILGMIVFVSPIKLPTIILEPLTLVGSMNTPLAMIVLGTYIAKSNIVEVFKSKQAYFVSFIRLVVVPIVTIFIFKLIPNQFSDIKKVVIIATSAPTAVMVAMLAQQYGGDYEQGARIVSLSTLLCLITMPIMIILSEIIW